MWSEGKEMPRHIILGLQYKDGAWRDIRGNIPEFFPKNGDWKPTNELEHFKDMYQNTRNASCLIWTGK